MSPLFGPGDPKSVSGSKEGEEEGDAFKERLSGVRKTFDRRFREGVAPDTPTLH